MRVGLDLFKKLESIQHDFHDYFSAKMLVMLITNMLFSLVCRKIYVEEGSDYDVLNSRKLEINQKHFLTSSIAPGLFLGEIC